MNNKEGPLIATVTDSAPQDVDRLSDGPDWTFALLGYLDEITE